MAKSSRADGRHRCEIFIMRNRRSASKNEKAQVWDVTNKDIDLINRGKIFTRANRSGMPKDRTPVYSRGRWFQIRSKIDLIWHVCW